MSRHARTDAASPRASREIAARLLRREVAPHRLRLVLAVTLMAVVALATGAMAYLLEPAIDDVFVARAPGMVYLVPLALVLVALAKAIAAYGQSVLMSDVAQRIIADIHRRLFTHLMRSDLGFIEDRQTGKLVSSFLYDVALLRHALAETVTGIAKNGLTALFLAGVMIHQDWRLASITLVVFPVVAWTAHRLGRRIRKASTRLQEETGALGAILADALKGLRVIKAYNLESHAAERAGETIRRRYRFLMKTVRTRAAATPGIEAAGAIAAAVAIFYGASSGLTVGSFMSFMGAMLMAYQPLKGLANLNLSFQEGLAAAARIYALEDERPRIEERPRAAPLRVPHGEVRFEGVHFRYDGGPPTLEGLDLHAEAGGRIALVGPSGAGKSTIFNLLLRFCDPISGRITIDGQDISEVTLESLRRSIALVTQDPILFDGTVRENIRAGRPDAAETEIVSAARAAQADEFIRRLAQGYDSPVGEGGARLSGGERQRLAIARAILKDAPILLLDEATSALDGASERAVGRALGALMKGRTTLVIAHRLSTVVNADRIFVIDGGRVVDQGTHETLIAKPGPYRRLYGDADDEGAGGLAHVEPRRRPMPTARTVA